ncbi:MAG: hypothetical protein LBE15_01685 [Burkholderiales bacterium]|jgi:hypothetical protein|nr:hypothetical protein [Burkholderiales bacterium]
MMSSRVNYRKKYFNRKERKEHKEILTRRREEHEAPFKGRVGVGMGFFWIASSLSLLAMTHFSLRSLRSFRLIFFWILRLRAE